MAWTSSGSILLGHDWQYTEPIPAGSFFRLKHTEAPNGGLFVIGQCEVDSSGKLFLIDSQVMAVEKPITDVFRFPKPGCFTERRIAIKKLSKQPSLQQELRRLFLPGYLQPTEEEIRIVSRSNWSIDIEVSDFIEPVLITSSQSSTTNTTTPTNNPNTTNTQSDPNFANVVLLLHMDGDNNSSTFVDIKGNTITSYGTAKISTTETKFGISSAYFDGAGSYLSIPINNNFTFGESNFTWECWVRPSVVTPSSPMTILGNALGGAPNNAGLFLNIFNSKFMFRHWVNGSFAASSSQTISANTWYHVAVTKVDTILKIYVDGIEGSFGSTTLANTDSNFIIGRTPGNASYASDYNGYIDEIRITKGLARYTANFTPPTSPFPNN